MKTAHLRLSARLFLVFACAAPLACSSAQPGPTTQPDAAGTSTASPKPASTMGLTGVLSEEEFKALHELKKESAPPRKGQMIDVEGTKAYLTLPEGQSAPMPAVLVIHEWWGLNEHIMHWADRLAGLGYAALAVDLYGGKVTATPDDAMAAMKAVNEDQALKTLLAANKFLAQDPRVHAERRAVIGWCFGGGWSLRLALAAPDLSGAIIYYGRLVNDPAQLSSIKAPILGVFGNMDKGIPPSAVEEFDKALHEANVPHEIHRYDADHAFANPSGARYDQKSAADAWEHVKTFLAKNLKKSE